jgi:hypothetical protein
MPQITIDHQDGSTDTIPETVSGASGQANYQITRDLGKMTSATVRVDRADVDNITLERKRDDVQIGSDFTGRLTDVQRVGGVVVLTVDSFEWLANNVEPTRGGLRKTGSNDQIIQDFIDMVPELSAGTIANTADNLTFVFNHALPSEAMRRVEKNVPGELRFNSDKTVDFVDTLGSDKSGSVEISTSAGTIDGEPQLLEQSRRDDATHLRVIGAHEGEAQFFANVVPAADSASYENRVDYTNNNWSDGDKRDWERYENADAMSQSVIEQEGAELISELQNDFIKVRVPTVNTSGLVLGDTVSVVIPELDINTSLRVVKLKTVQQGATTRYELTLSNRNKTDERGDKWKRDITRFNTAFEGNSVWGNFGGYRGAVNETDDYELFFRYPNVEFEHRVELFVRGLPFRADSQGVAAGGGDVENINPADFSTGSNFSGGEFCVSETYDNVSDANYEVTITDVTWQ